jgi:hypothetical protein
VVMVGGVLFVWFALLGALGRYERCAGDDEAEREEAAADFEWAGADGFVEDDAPDARPDSPGCAGAPRSCTITVRHVTLAVRTRARVRRRPTQRSTEPAWPAQRPTGLLPGVELQRAHYLEDGERVMIAFLVAGAALERGGHVAMFLTKDARGRPETVEMIEHHR